MKLLIEKLKKTKVIKLNNKKNFNQNNNFLIDYLYKNFFSFLIKVLFWNEWINVELLLIDLNINFFDLNLNLLGTANY
jgi:hypothetical protein